LLANKQEVPASIIVTGQANATVANRIIADVAEVRKDVVVCVSPIRTAVVNNVGSEATSISTWADTVTRSTYAVADSGWKYQYDKYNDAYVYVPLNADTAGCIARNDSSREPWLSPAGFTNGRIQNLVRLAFNPNQSDRDTLYKYAINPIFTQVGRGTVLFGDKTFTLKNTSMNRVNVRKLFIELQTTIGSAADNVLFDQNDATTRAGFVNLIVPYLRSVQARRGITAFRVVCDERNNPEDVVNANEFVCDIFVQPIRSVNFIQLNFVSVRGNATFSEIAA
jgi:phage tail sheath protein FI